MVDLAAEFDTAGEGEASASPVALEKVHEAIQDMIALEEITSQLEDDLKEAKKALQHIKTGTLPDLMAELQLDDMTHKGWSVKLSDFVSGSIPKDDVKRQAAFAWLKAHDASGLIKTDVKLSFGREQHKEAIKVAKVLVDAGHTVNVAEGVHAQTLASFARQRIKDGDDIDTEVLGLFIGKVVKAKKVKA